MPIVAELGCKGIGGHLRTVLAATEAADLSGVGGAWRQLCIVDAVGLYKVVRYDGTSLAEGDTVINIGAAVPSYGGRSHIQVVDTETDRLRTTDILEADIVDCSRVSVEGAKRSGILIEPIEHQTMDTREAVNNGCVGVPTGLDIDGGQQGEVVNIAPR